MKKNILYLLFMAILWVAMAFSGNHPEKGKLMIRFEHYVGNLPLQLDSGTYKNELGQNFNITNFKYYISNIHLKNKNGKEYASAESFLVSESEITSKQIMLSDVPPGEYSSIRFIVGVDSIHNCSGAQSGALDPINGMFWAWNTGYIFLKLEGKSPASTSPGHFFEYHIGGYKKPSDCIRTISLTFPETITVAEKTSSISIKTDAAEILRSPKTIDFSSLSSVTDFHHATEIADNYPDMFSITEDHEK